MASDQHHEERAEEEVHVVVLSSEVIESPHSSEPLEATAPDSDYSAAPEEGSDEDEQSSKEGASNAGPPLNGFNDRCNLQEWELKIIRQNAFTARNSPRKSSNAQFPKPC